jgi:hypothetical protein
MLIINIHIIYRLLIMYDNDIGIKNIMLFEKYFDCKFKIFLKINE